MNHYIDTVKEKISTFRSLLKEETPKKYRIVCALILLTVILCELFIFNFKWINSAFDKKINISPSAASEGISVNNGDIRINNDQASIVFENVNSEIKYLRFSPEEDEEAIAQITVSASDEANVNGVGAPSRIVLGEVKRSQYIRMHFSGKVERFEIRVNGMQGQTIKNGNLVINARVPLMFSWLRTLILALALMILYAVRPGSSLYRYKTDLSKTNQKIIAAVLIAVQAAAIGNMITWNKGVIKTNTNNISIQYYKLVDSFKEGRLDITANDVSQELKNLENPYDTTARQGVGYNWDYCYYNEKYYVYFGVVPVLTMYLPYNIITGKDLPHHIAGYILSLLILIGIMLLLWEIIKKWFKNTPFILYLMMSAVFASVSGIVYFICKPSFYSIPIMEGIAFGLIGLALWISAKTSAADNKGVTKFRFVPWRLAIGSVCIALIAGCRPQLLLILAIGVMLFWNDVFKDRTLFSKTSIKETASICIPFVIIAAGLMWYNFARFGSPFDFGSNYNLTTNDMTHRGFVWGRTGLGLFTYFFQPLKLESTFPFLKGLLAQPTYQGLTIIENTSGGLLLLFPILLVGVYGLFKRNIFKDKRAYRIVYFSVIIAVVLAVLDTQMAGLLARYTLDFSWFMMIAACVTVFAYYESYEREKEKKGNFIPIVTALSFITVTLAFLSIFDLGVDVVSNGNPATHYAVQHLMAFWM